MLWALIAAVLAAGTVLPVYAALAALWLVAIPAAGLLARRARFR